MAFPASATAFPTTSPFALARSVSRAEQAKEVSSHLLPTALVTWRSGGAGSDHWMRNPVERGEVCEHERVLGRRLRPPTSAPIAGRARSGTKNRARSSALRRTWGAGSTRESWSSGSRPGRVLAASTRTGWTDRSRLFRLGPDPGPRAEALRAAAHVEGHYAAALRYALGGDGETVGPDARIWVAAARARAPRADDPLVEAHTIRASA